MLRQIAKTDEVYQERFACEERKFVYLNVLPSLHSSTMHLIRRAYGIAQRTQMINKDDEYKILERPVSKQDLETEAENDNVQWVFILSYETTDAFLKSVKEQEKEYCSECIQGRKALCTPLEYKSLDKKEEMMRVLGFLYKNKIISKLEGEKLQEVLAKGSIAPRDKLDTQYKSLIGVKREREDTEETEEEPAKRLCIEA